MPIDAIQISHAITAIGGLGTAAYGVVDTTKVGKNGGISNKGFSFIANMLQTALPTAQAAVASVALPADGKTSPASSVALNFDSIRETLHANWINGVASDDQKAIAKSLIKLNLTPVTAAHFAALTGTDAVRLSAVAVKMAQAATAQLTPQESDALGRFDLALSSLLDQAYERADQKYRNCCKFRAMWVALALALIGGWAMEGNPFWHSHDVLKAIAAGLLACPLAPVAKDLSSAIQAGAQLAQEYIK
jgi:hypothetical protein